MRALSSVGPEVFGLLPVLCINESNEFEPNLSRDKVFSLGVVIYSVLQ